MALLESIEAQRKLLKHTATKVTTTSGAVLLVDSATGTEDSVAQKIGQVWGFVPDTRPDLQVADVLPGLTFGAIDVTMNVDILQQHNISHILSLGMEADRFANSDLIHKYIPMFDLPEQNLISVLSECFEFIDEGRNANGSVYVHCNAGVSRSASVVIAYLIAKERMSYDEALYKLQTVRPAVCPNPGFVQQLKDLK